MSRNSPLQHVIGCFVGPNGGHRKGKGLAIVSLPCRGSRSRKFILHLAFPDRELLLLGRLDHRVLDIRKTIRAGMDDVCPVVLRTRVHSCMPSAPQRTFLGRIEVNTCASHVPAGHGQPQLLTRFEVVSPE